MFARVTTFSAYLQDLDPAVLLRPTATARPSDGRDRAMTIAS